MNLFEGLPCFCSLPYVGGDTISFNNPCDELLSSIPTFRGLISKDCSYMVKKNT